MINLELKLNPAIKSSKIGDFWRTKNILWLDINAVKENEQSKEAIFSFDLGFNAIDVPIKYLVKRDKFYIGCSGGKFEVLFHEARIVDHTQDASINIKYNPTIAKEKITDKSLSAGKENKAQGKLVNQKSSSESKTYYWESTERVLASLNSGDSVSWDLSFPQKQNLIRDYLFGNIYLFVKVNSENNNFSGKSVFTPDSIQFFGSDKKYLKGGGNVLLMYVALQLSGKKVYNPDGLRIDFKNM